MIIEGSEYETTRDFYKSRRWEQVRAAVLAMDHWECQECKRQGKYTKATTVHHVHHLKDRPDLALHLEDEDGNRNLVSLCAACHNRVHPEKQKRFVKSDSKFTEERW